MAEAARLIEDGIRCGDPVRIGKGATRSALANQQLLFKPRLEEVLELSKQVGAAGVNVAHSGTVIGILFADDGRTVERAADLVRQQLVGLESVRCCRLAGGGVRQWGTA